jgi:hypothetical protein
VVDALDMAATSAALSTSSGKKQAGEPGGSSGVRLG